MYISLDLSKNISKQKSYLPKTLDHEKIFFKIWKKYVSHFIITSWRLSALELLMLIMRLMSPHSTVGQLNSNDSDNGNHFTKTDLGTDCIRLFISRTRLHNRLVSRSCYFLDGALAAWCFFKNCGVILLWHCHGNEAIRFGMLWPGKSNKSMKKLERFSWILKNNFSWSRVFQR